MVRVKDCYDAPQFWDLAFSDETSLEADFLLQVSQTFLGNSCPRVLEVGCGGGRQVIELTRRGCDVTAFDLNAASVQWTRKQLRRKKLSADVFQADMTTFTVDGRVDVAHCLVNTFRHLTSESAARQHLVAVANSLRAGGLYVLGFHLLPPDAAEYDCERWTVTAGRTRVTTTVRVLTFCRRTRLETVRFTLKVTTPRRVLRLATDHLLRIYRADQFRRLLKSVPELELIGVFDFCYDLSQPLQLNDDLGDSVFLLRRKQGR